jgi:hypothetical protein
MTVYQSVKMSRGNAGARWEGVLGATWDETYAKLGSGGMNGEGVREAGVFTREYIFACRFLLIQP